MEQVINLSFHKLDGAGNDFVGLDWRGEALPPPAEVARIARLLCHRYHGIGADGLIILLDAPTSGKFDFVMKYINSDGSVGEMCGNGARCAAVFAHQQGAASERMKFLTDAGEYRAVLTEGGSRVGFPDVEALPERRKLLGPLKSFGEVDFLRVGVPHAVAFVEDLDLLDVQTIGREVRFDQEFQPAGTNANFAEEVDGVLHLRTYERGVEGETQACGTGSVATACCHAAARKLEGPQRIQVRPTGGLPLFIDFVATKKGFSEISLEGPARTVFEGRCVLDLGREEVRKS